MATLVVIVAADLAANLVRDDAGRSARSSATAEAPLMLAFRQAALSLRDETLPYYSSATAWSGGSMDAAERRATLIHQDRLFPPILDACGGAPFVRSRVRTADRLAHGHTDPRWCTEDRPFPDPSRLFVVPDHYIFRMLYSQGCGWRTSA